MKPGHSRVALSRAARERHEASAHAGAWRLCVTLKPGSLTALGPTPTGTTCDTPCPHLGFLSLSCDVRLRPGKSVVQMSTGNHAGVPRKMQSPGLHPAPLNRPGQGCGRGQTVPGVCKRQPSTQWAKSIPQAGQGAGALPASFMVVGEQRTRPRSSMFLPCMGLGA